MTPSTQTGFDILCDHVSALSAALLPVPHREYSMLSESASAVGDFKIVRWRLHLHALVWTSHFDRSKS